MKLNFKVLGVKEQPSIEDNHITGIVCTTCRASPGLCVIPLTQHVVKGDYWAMGTHHYQSALLSAEPPFSI